MSHMRVKYHMSIGNRLRELMTKEGRSVRKTSIDLGIDRSSLTRILGESANPEWNTIKRIMDYLGYEITFTRRRKSR